MKPDSDKLVPAINPATRFECPTDGVGHDRGDGRPPRKACRRCGAAFMIRRGWFGVFPYRADGRYRWSDAIGAYARRKPADLCASLDDTYVVRFLTV